MNEQPPIGRYILIAIIFVLVFIGLAYLAFRFTTQNNGSVTPVTSPTPSQVVSYGGGSTILPAPALPPVSPFRYYTNTPHPVPTATTVTNYNGKGISTVAYDGRGNLLIDNLTHEENAALTQTRLNNGAQIELARINANNQQGLADKENRQRETTQRLSNDLELQKLNNSLTQYRLQQQFQRDQLAYDYQNRLAAQQLSAQLERDRLKATQASTKAAAEDQVKLIEAQSKADLAKQNLQYAYSERNQAQQQNTQLYQSYLQTYSTLSQSELQARQQLASQALSIAQQKNDQKYALKAQQLQAKIASAQVAQQHQNNLEYTQLQAQINQSYLELQSYVQSQQPNYGGYGNSYGYGNYSYNPYQYNNQYSGYPAFFNYGFGL